MKLLNYLPMLCVFALFNQGLTAQEDGLVQIKCQELYSSSHSHSCCESHLGSVGLATSNPTLWYDVNVPAYPESVLMSKNRNAGFRQGGVRLHSTGLEILEPGNYSVSFKATLLNPLVGSGAVVSVLLGFNGAFDPDESSSIGSVVPLQADGVGVAQATGILENVPAGTTLSLFGSNGGGEDPQLVKVIGWDITVFKIACD